ncbi:MAG: ABC transporter permease [Hyphomicrobiaceae bacterium]
MPSRRSRLPGLLTAIGRQALSVALTFLGLTCVTFVIGRMIPTDPVIAIVGQKAPEDVYQRVFHELGLDQPIYVQYWRYLMKVLHGDFGVSLFSSKPVLHDLMNVFPATIELSTVAILIGVLLGVPLGVAAAARQGKLTDHVIRVLGLIGYSMPVFWLGMVGLLLFYGKLDWLPGPGRFDVMYEGWMEPTTGFMLIDSLIAGEPDIFWDSLRHLILPATLLGYLSLAYIARMTRSFMLKELRQEYVLTAQVKGLSRTAVIWGHAFRNILVSLITVIALSYGYLLEGAVLTETVFSWPGLGLYMKNGLFNADMNAVLGGTMVVGIVFIGLNLLSDLAYWIVDPRAR